MNIEQYRALKAQEQAQAQQTVEQPATVQVEQTKPVVEETKPIEETKTEDKPITFEINGKEVSIDELKNGYLRQADYTKKTQDLSRQKTEAQEAIAFYEYMKKNPQIAEQVKNNGGKVPDRVDPALAKVKELEDKMYDMMLEKEIDTLTAKYKDFEIREVLEIASEKGLTNLEDAYAIFKATKTTNTPVDVEELKEQIRKDLLKELEAEKGATQTIISSTNQSVATPSNKAILSENEAKVAKMMKLSPEDYIKWRDIDKKK